MPCFSPVAGWRGEGGKLTQNPRAAVSPVPMTISCGGCVGCRVGKTSEWAARAVLELRSFAVSSFINLTYSPERLPKNSTLNPKHLRDFWKRLRIGETRKAAKLGMSPPLIRYFACGEYGDQFLRPHYHAIVFGYEPSDGVVFKMTDFGPLYKSVELSEYWTHGFATFGSVQYESAAYVASYVQKKLTGRMADEAYQNRFPPFAVMSTKPGLGLEAAHFLQPEMHDDKLWLGGDRFAPVPRYFMEYLKVSNPSLYEVLRGKRKGATRRERMARFIHQTPERLKVREEVFTAGLMRSHKEMSHVDF